jgi:hypothetical protein
MIKISLTFFLLFITFSGVAQQSVSFTSDGEKTEYRAISDKQKKFMYETYYQGVGDIDELINGREYVPYYYRARRKPILLHNIKYTTSLLLNGRRYDSISLQYDTYLDELIYCDSTKVINNRIYQIALNKDPVDGFGLFAGADSLFFRHLDPAAEPDFNLPEGFYEIVYDEISKYIIRHLSVVIEKDGIDEYFYKPASYVMTENGYSRVRSTSGFIKLFGEKSDEIRKFIRNSKINIRKADKQQITKVLKYYDSLLSSESLTK